MRPKTDLCEIYHGVVRYDTTALLAFETLDRELSGRADSVVSHPVIG